MSFRSTRLCCVLILVCSIGPFVHAQQVTGLPNFGSFSGGSVDTVNNANANVHFSFPLVSRAGRSTSFGYALAFDSGVWSPVTSGNYEVWSPAANWGWSTVTQPQLGYLSYGSGQSSATCPINPPYNMNTVTVYWTNWYNFAYVDAAGSVHAFPIAGLSNWQEPSGVSVQCGGGPTNGPITATASDGSGYTLTVSSSPGNGLSVALQDRAGTHIEVPQLGTGSGSFTDANGNVISASVSGGTTTFTDTLGSAPLTVSGSGTPSSPLVLSYPDPKGGSSSLQINYTNQSVQTKFGCSGVGEYTSPSQALVSSINLPDGTSYSFTYELTNPGSGTAVTGRLQSVQLPSGGTLSYAYSGINCASGAPSTLTRTTPDGAWTYSVSGSATTITDPQANQTALQFQGIYETGRQVYQGSASPGTLLSSLSTCYNGCTGPASLPITQVNTTTVLPGSANLQSATVVKYDQYGLLYDSEQYNFGTNSTGPLLSSLTVTYNRTLGNGIVDRPSDVVQISDGKFVRESAYSYDGAGLVSTSGTPNLSAVSGSRGNVATIQQRTGNATWLTHSMQYYDTGNLYSSTDVNGAQTTYTDGACGNSFVTAIAAPLSLNTSQTWDCNGAVQTSVVDANGWTSKTVYGDAKLWRPTSAIDPTGRTLLVAYGTSPISSETSFGFNGNATVDARTTVDGLGRPSVVQTRQGEGLTNFDSVETDYDALGRPSRSTVPYTATAGQTNSSVAGVTTTYDALNRPLTVTDGGGGVTTYSYSQNDVLVTVGPAPSGEKAKQRQLEYDAAGRLVSVCEITHAAGSGTCGQNTAQTGYWTKYTYNGAGDLLQVVQNAQGSSSQTRNFVYDLLGRLLTETNPENGQTSYVYDSDKLCGSSAGDMVKRTDANSNVTCYDYDALHRNTQIIYSSGPNAANTNWKFFVYDAATVNGLWMANAKGRLAEAYTGWVTNKITDEGFSYSSRGEVVDTFEATPTSGGYYHVSASYWDNGLVKTLATNLVGLPGWNYYPDGEGRVSSVSATSGQNPLTSASYSAFGVTGITFGSADSDSFTYDAKTGRQTQYGFNVNGSSETGTLTWNANGTLGQLAIVDPFVASDNQTCTNTYDDLMRLVGNNCGSVWSQTFGYDAFGNIDKAGSSSFQPTYNLTSNSYATLPGGTPSYDSNGAVINDGYHSYGWDADGKNLQIDGNAVVMTYDALGRWVERNSSSGVSLQAVYGPDGAMLAEAVGQTVLGAYLHLPGGAVAHYVQGGALGNYWHADWLGTARLYSSPARTATGDIAYAPFGEAYVSGPIDSLFTGVAQSVEANDFRNFPARDLHTIEGRWLTPDPAGLAAVDPANPQTWNRYAYVGNNPLNATDPSGMTTCDANGTNCQDIVNVNADGGPPLGTWAWYMNGGWRFGSGQIQLINIGGGGGGSNSSAQQPPPKKGTPTTQQIRQACVNEWNNSAAGKVTQFFSLYNLATNFKEAWPDWTLLPVAKLLTLKAIDKASQAIGNTEFLSLTGAASTTVLNPTATAIHGSEKVAGRLAIPALVAATGVDALVNAGCANSALNATGQANIPMAPTMF